MTEVAGQAQNHQLNRSLNLFLTTSLVIGTVVGSGIFVSSAQMARELQNPSLLMGVWVFAGLMTLLGALIQCELVGQMPETGGLYRYLHQIYGEKIGFLYGWANFTIAGSGAISALAFIFANYVNEFIPLPHLSPELEGWAITIPYLGSLYPLADLGMKLIGIALILFLTALNIRGVKLGAIVQSISTSAKFLALLFIGFAAFFFAQNIPQHTVTTSVSKIQGMSLLSAIVTSLSCAFWAYDGWGNAAYIAGEVKNPEKTLPRAIVIGTLGFIILYLFTNAAYLHTLSVETMGKVPGDRVATASMTASIGSHGALIIAALIILSTFDATNSSILTNGRVYFAMAMDRIFSLRVGSIHSRFQTPVYALAYQGIWSAILLFTGSFELVTSMFVFVNWFLYFLQAVGLFIMRRRYPERHRPFKIFGYPYVPMIFVIFSFFFVLFTLVNDISDFSSGKQPIIKSLMGVLLVISGLPLYFYWKKKHGEKIETVDKFEGIESLSTQKAG